jgi:ribose transport system ATP-binding protein
LSIRENAFLNPGASGRGLFDVLAPRREAEEAVKLGALVGLRPNDPHLAIEGLSGGNQQKVVVGRWLATGRKLLVAEDPTAGVDVGAKAEIYRIMRDLAASGVAILMISSELTEVVGMADRVIVMRQGRITGELQAVDATEENIMHLATTGHSA